MSIVTEYPFWLILICSLLAGAVSWFLYKNYPIQFEYRKKLYNSLLAISRFVVLFFLALFLVNPLIKTINKRIEKPLIILALDHSQSVLANKDSVYIQTKLVEQMNQLGEKLKEEYQVEKMIFGDETQAWPEAIKFNARQTNISQVFNEFAEKYDHLNIGAMVLASDGIYNKGSNPVYEAEKYKFPVYTIALGDTVEQRDIKIYKVRHNEVAFLGNKFPVNIEIQTKGYPGKTVSVNVSNNGNAVFQQNISITGDEQSFNIPLELDAKESGVQHYKVVVSSLPGELSYVNNQKDFFIEILDGKQKVLLVAAAPHPDLGALKNAIESNKNYELKIYTLGEMSKIVYPEAYNLVIFHQVPAASNNAVNFIQSIKEKKIPQLYILGSQSQVSVFNSQQNILSIPPTNTNANDAVPLLNNGFGLFTLTEESANRLKNLPPLSAPYGNYNVSKDADILFSQQIGYVKTNTPLVLFSKNADLRTGVIAGEGLWRWRMSEYATHHNTIAFDELLSKTIQYLSVKEDKRPFRFINAKKFFNENEPLQFDAELYNESYELVNTPEVAMDLFDEANKKYHYVFTRTSNAYTLDAGLFPHGNYRYHASTTLNGKIYNIDGKLSILPLQAELSNTQADHRLLANISAVSNGKLFYPTQMDSIMQYIKTNEEIKPVSYSDRQTNDLIHYKWLFFLLLSLLGIEWLVRKMQGTV